MTRPRVITLTGYFLPGFRGGGPIRTLVNLAEQLGGEFDFRFVTNDHDLGESQPYPGIISGHWQNIRHWVYYVPAKRKLQSIFRVLSKRNHYDVVYLNSFFSPYFTIVPLLLRRLRLTRPVPFIVAPRGELFHGALGLKGTKKKVYMRLARALGLYRNVLWQASSEYEAEAIRLSFDSQADIVVAPDLVPADGSVLEPLSRKPKQRGVLRLLFLSRIARIKNLDGALRMLTRLKGEVEYNIYGPIEDQSYWHECQALIEQLPPNVQALYRGPVSHDRVSQIMAHHDVFLFPTHGENFGHVIPESLVAGTPVVLSDQTPWSGLEHVKAGWNIPLNCPEEYIRILQHLVDMGDEEHRLWSEGARTFGLSRLKDPTALNANRQLFGGIPGKFRSF